MGITVGIVNYNLARFLPRAIESALGAEEVILIDDRSTDKSVEIALRYPKVKIVVHKQNSGSAVMGWNELITKASQEWLMLLSADDELTPQTLGMIEHYGKYADWLWGQLELIDEWSSPIRKWEYNGWPTTVPGCQEYMRIHLQLYPTMIAAFRVSWLRENKLHAVGFKTTTMCPDTLTGWNWLKANPRLKFVPEVFARYRRWDGQESKKKNVFEYTNEFAEIVMNEIGP
ncbi:MAG: glycosyltransferase family 2 protein [Methanoregula sp.]|nr:glycosyltransferase family 2 protein [Methanoregula sp.]